MPVKNYHHHECEGNGCDMRFACTDAPKNTCTRKLCFRCDPESVQERGEASPKKVFENS